MKAHTLSMIAAGGCLLLGAAGWPASMAEAITPAITEEQRVMQVTQDACVAFLNADLAAAERLLAPEFTLVNSTALVQTRTEVLAEIRDRDPEYEVFRNHSMTAHVFGDAAIVQGITTVKGNSGGKQFGVDVRFTDTLIRRQGRWQLVVSHVTALSN